jgi:hypothetical protein
MQSAAMGNKWYLQEESLLFSYLPVLTLSFVLADLIPLSLFPIDCPGILIKPSE